MLWDPNVSLTEEAKLEEYLKQKIYEAFTLFHTTKKGCIEKKEVPYVMRYLGQFPSEAQVRDVILLEIEDDEPSDMIKFSKFEPYMLNVIKENEFEPDDPETILAAFKLLDPDGRGYIEIDEIREKLEKLGIEFVPKETKDFIDFATNNDPNATVIYYEDYLSRLYAYVEKHLEGVMKGYSSFSTKK